MRTRRDGHGHPLTLLIGLILGAALTVAALWFYNDHVLLHHIDEYLIMVSQGGR